jgi:DeoR/GlpR family transcriptional regulator of sugar metabolism
MDKRTPMPADRRRLILEMLRERGSVTVEEVQKRFGVSLMTARRDLTMLSESGSLRRTHGGAVLPGFAGGTQPFRSRVEQHVPAKLRVAEAVMGALKPRETVFLDSSSSSYYIARQILEATLPMTLITNSLAVIRLVDDAQATHLELIGLGGEFNRHTHSFVDSQTVRAIEAFSADRVIFSISGIAPNGSLTDPDPAEATVKRAMIGHARTVVLVATAEEFTDRGPNIVVPAAAVDAAYLADSPRTASERLEALGVRTTHV